MNMNKLGDFVVKIGYPYIADRPGDGDIKEGIFQSRYYGIA